MYFFLVAFGVALHMLFWGAGVAWWAMPRSYRSYWPILAGPAGIALQSVVVWFGAYANWRGTDTYAIGSELLPLGLLVAAIVSRGGQKWWQDVARVWGVWLAMGLCLTAIVLIMAQGARGVGLTSMSMGSCDAADYAAGARVLKEFAHSDRTGFLGLTEVVSIASTDNFFDFWLRLNHFTPSALIALNGTILNCQPHELTGVLTAVLLALSVPVVFWLARSALRYSAAVSVGIALLYGFSPVTWYAVFQVATAQLLAALAIALLTWSGVLLWRRSLMGKRGWAMSGVLGLSYAIILGSYNFILLVALVPAVAYAGGLALWSRDWLRLVRWGGRMLVPLVVVGLIFYERVAGLAERFLLFQSFDFGWKIHALTPEGWLGMVRGTELDGFPLILRVVLGGFVLATLIFGLSNLTLSRRRDAYLVASLTIPALVGYAYLYFRGVRLGTNASYDAYKILSVFFPGLLAATGFGLTLLGRVGLIGRVLGAGLGVLAFGFTMHADYRFAEKMSAPPLIVGRDLVGLHALETTPGIESVNLRIPDMWSRLWANAFLLKIPQYFSTHTYEGRRNTPLKGQWDLNGDLIKATGSGPGVRRINDVYGLTDTRAPSFLRTDFGVGWYELEGQAPSHVRWRWGRASSAIAFVNPQPWPLSVELTFTALESAATRDLQWWLDGSLWHTATVHTVPAAVRLKRFEIPAHATVNLEMRTGAPVASDPDGDSRELALRFFPIELNVR